MIGEKVLRRICSFLIFALIYAAIIYLGFLCGEYLGPGWGLVFCLAGILFITFEIILMSEWL
jgi:hypothetical protein